MISTCCKFLAIHLSVCQTFSFILLAWSRKRSHTPCTSSCCQCIVGPLGKDGRQGTFVCWILFGIFLRLSLNIYFFVFAYSLLKRTHFYSSPLFRAKKSPSFFQCLYSSHSLVWWINQMIKMLFFCHSHFGNFLQTWWVIC